MAIIKPDAVPFTRGRLDALTRAVHRARGDLYDGLLLQGLAVEALHKIYKCEAYFCPVCGNLMSTVQRRDECPHVTHRGEPMDRFEPEVEKTFRHWLTMAEREDWRG